MPFIERHTDVQDGVAFNTSIGSCTAINFEQYCAGSFQLDSGDTSITAINWYGCDTKNGTYTALEDDEGAALTSTVGTAGNWTAMPAKIMSAAPNWIKGLSVGASTTSAKVSRRT